MLLWISLAVLLFTGGLPILKMLFVSISTWMHDGVSLSLITHSSLLRTLVFSVSVAFLSTTLGLLLALLFAKTDIPFAPLWMTILSLPLLLPSDIVALGWTYLLLPFGDWLGYLESFGGAMWIEITVFMPVAMLLCYLFLRRIPYDIELAALLYVDEKKLFRFITLALLRPALVLSFLIVALLSLGEYAVPNTLHIKLYSVDLFTRFSAFYDFDGALFMSLPLLLVAVVAIAIEHITMRTTHFSKMARRSYRIRLEPLTRTLLLIWLAFMLLLCTLLPLWGLIGAIDSSTHF